jgi:hypothetical protein
MKNLTVVSAGRNDDHGGRFLERLYGSVRSLSAIARHPRINIEYLFVEWNPVPDVHRIYSMEHLWRPLTHSSFSIRFIEVPSEIHNELAHADRLPFFQMIAKNVGIRRATHRAILATTSDVIFSPFFQEIFANHDCDPRMFYRCVRNDVKRSARSLEALSNQDLVQYCKDNVTVKHALRRGSRNLFTDACGDFTLAHKDIWNRTRGYIELPIFSIHLDTLWLLCARNLFMVQKVLPPMASIYHMDHEDSWTPQWTEALKEKVAAKNIPMLTTHGASQLAEEIYSGKRANNNENWGYADRRLREFIYI